MLWPGYQGRPLAAPSLACAGRRRPGVLGTAGGLGLLNALRLALAALLVILARDRGHHLQQHRVDRAQHPVGKLVALGVPHPLVAGGQVDRHDLQTLGVDGGLELLLVVHRQAGKTVDGFHQEQVTLPGIFEQAQQLRAICGRSAGILQVHAGYDLVMVAGELLERDAGSAGALLIG